MRSIFTLIFFIVIHNFLATLSFAGDHYHITINSGKRFNNYNIISEELCSYLNSNGHNCKIVLSSGSYDNLELIVNNRIDFSFLQLDHLINFRKNTNNKNVILPILKIYDESLSIITVADSDINSFYDLHGKKISTNGPNGGSRLMLNKLSQIIGDEFKIKFEDNIVENDLIESLCNGEIDAISIATTHPSIFINEINRECAIKFIEISSSIINQYSDLKDDGYYKYVIADNVYKGISYPTTTIATNNILAVGENESEMAVYVFLKAIYDVLHDPNNKFLFQRMNSDFSPPKIDFNLHPGAEKFFLSIGKGE